MYRLYQFTMSFWLSQDDKNGNFSSWFRKYWWTFYLADFLIHVPFFVPSERERFWQTEWTRCWLCRAGYWLLVSKVECPVWKKTNLNFVHIYRQFVRPPFRLSHSFHYCTCRVLKQSYWMLIFIFFIGEQHVQAWHWWAFLMFLCHIVSPLSEKSFVFLPIHFLLVARIICYVYVSSLHIHVPPPPHPRPLSPPHPTQYCIQDCICCSSILSLL